MQNHLLLSEEIVNMKKNWKKLFSVLLLAALLCALPGTLAWGTDVDAITPDGSGGNQIVGDQTGGDQTGGDQTGGNQTGGDQTGGNQTGGDQTGGNQTGGNQSGGDQTSGTQTGGDQTSGTGSGSSTETGNTSGGSTATDTPTDQSGSGSSTTTEESSPPTPTTPPTPTPTPTPSLPVITKDPTDETVNVGGDCWFIADYSNALYAVWHCVSPDGRTDYRYDAQEVATAFPGLRIENGDYSALHLLNIPAEMNGWRACCEYRNNTGSVRTNYAVVHVNGAPAATPSPSPSATPTPSPSPSPTPTSAATATPAATSIPVATSSPVLSPTPEGTGEPPAALNRGGKIFLLFGAAALVVGAAAIGTILHVSKQMSAKEAYTYKSSTRRKK